MFSRIITTAFVVIFASIISVSAQQDSNSQVGQPSINCDFVLPVSSISDAAIDSINQAGDDYLAKRELRTACAPLPHCDINALRSIISNNETLVKKICYGKESANSIIQKMTLDELAVRYQKSSQDAKIPATEVTIDY